MGEPCATFKDPGGVEIVDVRGSTALGENVNVTARLSSKAGTGEILISQAAYEAVGLALGDPEWRELELKGKSGRTEVRVLRI